MDIVVLVGNVMCAGSLDECPFSQVSQGVTENSQHTFQFHDFFLL